MKISKWVLLSGLFAAATQAQANLPASAVSSLMITVYGVFTSSDATCLSGFQTSVPISATAGPINFAAGAPAGSPGPVASPVNCLVMVVKNSLAFTIASGSYTTTSTNTQSITNNDSNCNSGGTQTINFLPSGLTPVWPSTITSAASAAGLTLTTTTTGTASDVVPIYFSINSACAGASSDSTSICGASDANLKILSPPGAGSSAKSSPNGLTLTSFSGNGGNTYLEMKNYFGGVGSTANFASGCGQFAPSQFIIHQ